MKIGSKQLILVAALRVQGEAKLSHARGRRVGGVFRTTWCGEHKHPVFLSLITKDLQASLSLVLLNLPKQDAVTQKPWSHTHQSQGVVHFRPWFSWDLCFNLKMSPKELGNSLIPLLCSRTAY